MDRCRQHQRLLSGHRSSRHLHTEHGVGAALKVANVAGAWKIIYTHVLIFCSIPFSSIEAATNTTARFQLKYVNDTGQRDSVAVKLDSHQTSVSLYRSITEKHAFYSCETVGSAVTSQFVRDLKGTIASFFNENTDLGNKFMPSSCCLLESVWVVVINCSVRSGPLVERLLMNSCSLYFVCAGKKYVFDIQRTCREVYDNARRILYQNGTVAVLPVLSPASHPSTGECVSSSCKVRNV